MNMKPSYRCLLLANIAATCWAGEWNAARWTGDEDSGINSAFPYTASVNCNGNAVTVNGIAFEAGVGVTSGTGYSIGGDVTGSQGGHPNIAGSSRTLANSFVNAKDARSITLTLTNLSVGETYEASIFAFGFDAAPTTRIQTFTSGSDRLVVDQNSYGQNTGIRISYKFVPDTTSKVISITPTGGGCFQMAALANRSMKAIRSVTPARDEVALLVRSTTYRSLAAEIERYRQDVQARFPVNLRLLHENWTSPEQVRASIKNLFKTHGTSGVVLVGDVPMHLFYMHEGINPNPLYYEDFDLNFEDANNHGAADRYTNGPPNLKIWVANIRAVEDPNDPGIKKLREFFNKTHAYYLGQTRIEPRALAVAGRHWSAAGTYFADRLGYDRFGTRGVDLLGGKIDPTADDYLSALSHHAYTMQCIQVHASHNNMGFWPVAAEAAQVAAIKGGALFTIHHGCDNSSWYRNYKEGRSPNTGMAYIFGQGIGQALIGQVRSGCIFCQDEILERIKAGDYVGKAYLAAKKLAEVDFYTQYPNGNVISGFLFLGNPFLSIPKASTTLDGELVTPVVATAQSYYTGSAGDVRTPVHAIDGTGMTEPPFTWVTPDSTCATNPAGTMWLSGGTRQTWITFDLGRIQTLGGFHLWNYNEPGFVERGVRTAGIYIGTSLPVNGSDYASQGAAWGTLVKNFTFSPASGLATYTGEDYAFLGTVTTRYIQIHVSDNFSKNDANTGISEIRFFTPPPHEAKINTFGIPGMPTVIDEAGKRIVVTVPFGTDPTKLVIPYTMSLCATCDKKADMAHDFTQPVKYTVTSDDFSIVNTYTVKVVVSGWKFGAWTDDATSGISNSTPYTMAVNLGGSAVTVNGVAFQASSLGGENFSVGGQVMKMGDSGYKITGASAALAANFIGEGYPRMVTLTHLTPGVTYETTFFSIGFESPGNRPLIFESEGDRFLLDQDYYGKSNGIWISHTFVANASGSRVFTIDRVTEPFNCYAVANRVCPMTPRVHSKGHGE